MMDEISRRHLAVCLHWDLMHSSQSVSQGRLLLQLQL